MATLPSTLTSQGGGTKLAFSKRIKVNLNSNWVAPTDGFLVYTGMNTCDNPRGATFRKMYINGLEIADLSEGKHGESNVNVSIPVAKGNTVKMVDKYKSSSIWYSYAYFYPLE